MTDMQDVTSDDKLWAMLAYVLSPIVPIIIFLMEDKKNRPFIKAHNIQALVWGGIAFAINLFLGWLIVPACVGVAMWAVGAYWGFTKAYKGEMVELPVVSNLVRNQGWA